MAVLEDHKQATYIRELFGRIAGRYDLLNRLITFGQDKRWRRFMVKQARLPENGKLLDAATGTGDVAFEALRQYPGLSLVAGVDFSRPMMEIGRQRQKERRILRAEGNVLALPYPDCFFDAAVSGYLMRNVGDVSGAFREQARVVKPGGWVICLDTTPPPRSFLYPFIAFHLRFVIPFLGWLIAGDKDSYTYLPQSTEGFKTPQELAAIMRQVGLVDVTYRCFLLGTMAVHSGRKPALIPYAG